MRLNVNKVIQAALHSLTDSGKSQLIILSLLYPRTRKGNSGVRYFIIHFSSSPSFSTKIYVVADEENRVLPLAHEAQSGLAQRCRLSQPSWGMMGWLPRLMERTEAFRKQ